MTTLRHAQEAGTIMKTLIAMSALAGLAVSAGNANAYADNSRIHKTYGYVHTTTAARHEQAAPLAARSEPIRDCVHVAFPQCSDNQVR
jgi:hypothetical protein